MSTADKSQKSIARQRPLNEHVLFDLLHNLNLHYDSDQRWSSCTGKYGIPLLVMHFLTNHDDSLFKAFF